jgi:hypothetical protein
MASTYSTNLKIELQATGENAGTWGTITNVNLGTALEQAIVGRAAITFSGATKTLTLTDTNAAQDARAYYLDLGGVPGGAATLEVPAVEKNYVVKNGTGQQVTIKVSGQTGVVIPNGKTVIVYNNGTDVVTSIDYIPSLTLGAALPVASGGTGITSFGTGVATALGNNVGSAGAFVTFDGDLGTPSAGNLDNCTADGTNEVGFRNVPQSGSAKTVAYTLVTGDVGKFIEVGASGAINIPDATFSAGDYVTIFNNTAGSVTITCNITTAYIAGTDTDRSSVDLATRGVCNVLFISGTVCVISGNVS